MDARDEHCKIILTLKPNVDLKRFNVVLMLFPQVSVYAVPAKWDQTQYALQAAIKLLEFYENYFNILYPLPKQGKPQFSAFLVVKMPLYCANVFIWPWFMKESEKFKLLLLNESSSSSFYFFDRSNCHPWFPVRRHGELGPDYLQGNIPSLWPWDFICLWQAVGDPGDCPWTSSPGRYQPVCLDMLLQGRLI